MGSFSLSSGAALAALSDRCLGCGTLRHQLRRRQWGAGPCSPGRSAQPAEPGGERQAVSPLTQTARGVSSLPAASLPLCGDAWVQGRRCCGPGHLPLLSAGALGPRGGQPLWRRGRASRWPEPALETWRTPPPPRQPTALCARARAVVGARARPARVEPGPRLRAAAAASSVPRQFSPLQTGVGSLARPLGRCLGGPHVGQGAALWEGSRPSVFESISEDSPLAEKHPGRSQLPGLPPAEAVSGGRMLAPPALSQGSPHLPQLPRRI